MMKNELEALLAARRKVKSVALSDDQWEIFHTIYQWHPMIHNVEGKHQIVDLIEMKLPTEIVHSLYLHSQLIEKADRSRASADLRLERLEDEIRNLNQDAKKAYESRLLEIQMQYHDRLAGARMELEKEESTFKGLIVGQITSTSQSAPG